MSEENDNILETGRVDESGGECYKNMFRAGRNFPLYAPAEQSVGARSGTVREPPGAGKIGARGGIRVCEIRPQGGRAERPRRGHI